MPKKVYGSEKTDQALHGAVINFVARYFQNNGDETFTMKPLDKKA